MTNTKPGIRLHKYLADAGLASRRGAEAMIAAGRAAVNGRVVTAPGVTVDPARDMVTLDGKPVKIGAALIYIMLHKPEGVITTVSDPQGRPTVMDLVQDAPGRVFPVGRLDYDSSGLLLMTNDGALAQTLTHPRHAAPKIYAARLRGVPDRESLRRFQTGLVIDGRRTAGCGIKITRILRDENITLARITLREGRNRQIRKMCEAVGCPVLSLKRVAVGPVRLGGLPRGAWRPLTEAEVAILKNLISLNGKRLEPER